MILFEFLLCFYVFFFVSEDGFNCEQNPVRSGLGTAIAVVSGDIQDVNIGAADKNLARNNLLSNYILCENLIFIPKIVWGNIVFLLCQGSLKWIY
ncbi:hypothetical protein [Gilliamella sp. Pas-s95]|uniref:hypothetical protein n=1 Tax=Gilliamella sp. Pas-s95 TaxID=2687317 RepID=UPI00132627DA|nr:hypothetical protein [Gilliamella sp. Pas-s95]MWN05659.1 hypothetical protein [Gilliamella sp. Pas-s95]